MFRESVYQNIWKYYVFKFLRGLSFIVPIYILFFLENNLSLSQTMFLLAIFSILTVVLEVPSGVFADLYGRKKSLILGAIIMFLGFFLRAASTSFLEFLFAMILLGTGLAFISGADSALLYDSLKECQKESLYKKISGKAYFFHSTAMALGSFIGGLLVIYGLRTVHYLMLIPYSLLIITAFSFKEPEKHKSIIKKNYFSHLLEGISFAITHKKVRNLILFYGFMIGLMISSHHFFQPYMKLINIPITQFGLLYLLFLGISAISSKYAYKIEEKLGEKKSIIIIPIIFALQLILMSAFSFYLGFIFLLLGEFCWGFSRPILKHYINEHIDSSHRATILSISSMFHQLVIAIFSPILGWITDLWTLQTALFVQGTIVIIIALFILSSWKLRKS